MKEFVAVAEHLSWHAYGIGLCMLLPQAVLMSFGNIKPQDLDMSDKSSVSGIDLAALPLSAGTNNASQVADGSADKFFSRNGVERSSWEALQGHPYADGNYLE